MINTRQPFDGSPSQVPRLKVLFISRASLYTDKGGDTVQVLNTADCLRKAGLQVDIRLCNEPIDYNGYDLLHFFNIIRPADILRHISRSGKPFVVSTIYVDYSEYEKKIRGGIMGLLFRFFSQDQAEYVKSIARWLVNGEKIISPSYLWLGQKRSIRRIIGKAAMLLPNSHSEYRRLLAHYGVVQAYRAIPNAIDPGLFSGNIQTPAAAKDPHLVLCVGRIEGRKNQMNLIRALNGTKYQLVIIGSASVNQASYVEQCRREAAQNISFEGSMSQQELITWYARAKVHVLPSWFETTGLSSLEAAAMRCHIVITDKGDTREYFGEDAWYCDPASPSSILDAIGKAADAPGNGNLQTKILSQYTWEQTARETLQAYLEITSNNTDSSLAKEKSPHP